jgi:hypothetical protein
MPKENKSLKPVHLKRQKLQDSQWHPGARPQLTLAREGLGVLMEVSDLPDVDEVPRSL